MYDFQTNNDSSYQDEREAKPYQDIHFEDLHKAARIQEIKHFSTTCYIQRPIAIWR